MTYDVVVIGGGIVGLATARALLERRPGWRVAVIEKESRVGAHQTGHNSGVIHSGIYYRPGSLKARLAREGNRRMVEYCAQHGIPHEVCGKVIVAADEPERPRLMQLYERGRQNGLNIRLLDADELREREPHVHGVAAIYVPTTGIVDYRQVCEAMAADIQAWGGEIHLSQEVVGVSERTGEVVVQTQTAEYHAQWLINCAGLFSDRVARMAGADTGVRIVPFRGEYYELVEEKRHLVRNLIYPVPDPDFPFLGVHFTRMIDGRVEVGPNAVLAWRREGYTKWDVNLRDLGEVLAYRGFRRLARRHWRQGLLEMVRSYSKRAFVRNVQRLLPEVDERDLRPAPAGVRAQAMKPDGTLVDDFFIVRTDRCVHVCNAPSPAATASLCIGAYVVREWFGE